MRLQLEQIVIRGFAQFDAQHALRRVVLPVTCWLADFLLVPFFAARLLCALLPWALLQQYEAQGGAAAGLVALVAGDAAGMGGVGRVAGEIGVQGYLLRTLLVRTSYHIYIALRFGGIGVWRACCYLHRLHNEIRDSKYLIGTKLTNRAHQE